MILKGGQVCVDLHIGVDQSVEDLPGFLDTL